MGKASAESFKPHEVESMARQQNRMNNPNVTNTFGSTTTEFGADDQANITQSLSPEMQGIIDSQMGFVGQGPAQLGNYQNDFLGGLMQGAAGNIGRRWGIDTPQFTGGGYDSQMPQFNQQQQMPPQDNTGPQPMGPPSPPIPIGGDGFDTPNRDHRQIPGAGISEGFNGGGGMWGNVGQMPDPSLLMAPDKSMSNRSQKGQMPESGLSFGIGQSNPNMDTQHKMAPRSLGDRMGMSQNAQDITAKLAQALQNMGKR